MKNLLPAHPPIEPDESLAGYLLRLAEQNHHDIPADFLAEFVSEEASSCRLLGKGLDLSRLSRRTGTSVRDLEKAASRPIDEEGRPWVTFGMKKVPITLLRRGAAAICPACLEQHGYLKKVWELKLVVACPDHQVLLVRDCPSCGERLSGNRSKVTRCRCRFDLRRAPTKTADRLAMDFTRFVEAAAGLRADNDLEAPPGDIPLWNVPLAAALEAVLLMACCEYSIKRWRRVDLLRMPYEELQIFIAKGFLAFLDWPMNFHAFLARVHQDANQSGRIGAAKQFGVLWNKLPSSPSDQLGFMRESFREYVLTKWDGGYVALGMKWFSKVAKAQSNYISGSEAANKLGISRNLIEEYVRSGILLGTVRSMGQRTLRLVDKTDAERLLKEINSTVSGNEVAQILGVSRCVVSSFAENKCIGAVSHPLRKPWGVYRKGDAEKLLMRMEKAVSLRKPGSRDPAISLEEALRVLHRTHYGSAAALARAVLDGKIKPCLVVEGNGLHRFYYSAIEIGELAKIKRPRKNRKHRKCNGCAGDGKPECSLTLEEVSSMTGIHTSHLGPVAENGLMEATKIALGPKRHVWRVSKEAVCKFMDTYVCAVALAKSSGLARSRLVEKLELMGILPVSGPGIDKGRTFFFRHKDVPESVVLQLRRSARPKATRRGSPAD